MVAPGTRGDLVKNSFAMDKVHRRVSVEAIIILAARINDRSSRVVSVGYRRIIDTLSALTLRDIRQPRRW